MKLTKRLSIVTCLLLLLGTATLMAQDAGAPPSTSASDDAQMVPATQGPPIFGPQQVAFRQAMEAIPFPFDEASLDAPGARDALQHDADWLKAHPDVKFSLQGYADWRGSVIYNMPLTQDRADAVRNALEQLGVSPDRILNSVGFGKITQLCEQQDESCWVQNRRVSLVYAPPGFEPNNAEPGGK
ncbi:MAG TPA: OmpA family protein [Terriglobales bacterium]|nr:OmpA family protein [Terriglobales bacterium]